MENRQNGEIAAAGTRLEFLLLRGIKMPEC